MAIDDSPGEHQSVIQSLQDTRNLMTFQQNTELDTVNIPRGDYMVKVKQLMSTSSLDIFMIII